MYDCDYVLWFVDMTMTVTMTMIVRVTETYDLLLGIWL